MTGTLSSIAGRSAKWYSRSGKRSLQNQIDSHPAVLSICYRELKMSVHRKISM